MVEVKDYQINAGLDELEKSFQEYRKKLEDTEQEAQQIIEIVREKADNIFLENQSKTQKMADEMIQAAKSEADKIIAEANVKAGETETMIKEQLSKAQKMVDEMMQAAQDDSAIRINETVRLIEEVSQRAENIIGQSQKQLHSELAELITRINKIKYNPDTRSILPKNEASTNNDKKNNSNNIRGQRKLVVIPPYNEVQTKELTEFLKLIPSIKIDGTSTMEDNFSISLNISEAVSLKRILSSISLIESSEFIGDIIKVKLKRCKINGVPYY
jgi:F0F1-type ATP synthase membrane subunit b/b'